VISPKCPLHAGPDPAHWYRRLDVCFFSDYLDDDHPNRARQSVQRLKVRIESHQLALKCVTSPRRCYSYNSATAAGANSSPSFDFTCSRRAGLLVNLFPSSSMRRGNRASCQARSLSSNCFGPRYLFETLPHGWQARCAAIL
jgi:hypothetical protein